MKLNKQERQNSPNNQKLRRMPCTGSGWSMLSYVLINIIPGLSVITPRRKSKRALIFSHNSSYFFRALRLLMRAAWALLVYVWPKLPALVYDILLLTTAVFSYATGSRKLSVNEQFFCWCSNSSKFVTNNSNKTRRVIYSRQQSLHQRE